MGVPGEGVGVSEGDDPVSTRTEGLRQRRLVAHHLEGAGEPLLALSLPTLTLPLLISMLPMLTLPTLPPPHDTDANATHANAMLPTLTLPIPTPPKLYH